MVARCGSGPQTCRQCLCRCLALALAALAAWGFLVSWKYQRYGDTPPLGVFDDSPPGQPAQAPGAGTWEGPLIHVLLCSDDTDLRPMTVAIKSAHASASDPGRLVFHVVTSPQLAPILQELLSVHLSGVRLEVHHDASIESRIESHLSSPESWQARKARASPFSFMPFYFDAFLSRPGAGWDPPEKVIYIDTDTVVLGDLAELFERDLRGHPTAAVPHCQDRLDDYVQFDVLRELGFTQFDPKACIVDRGLMVVDVPRWRALNVTGKIEDWMRRYRDAKSALWRGGTSQPPWTLALNGDYLTLGEEWSCMGLGREGMKESEVQLLKAKGLSRGALHQLRAHRGPGGGLDLVVEMCSRSGKVLHFDGEVKPWLVETLPADHPLPRCAPPDRLPGARRSWLQLVKLRCQGAHFVNCADIWSAYLSSEAACALKDFDKEWRGAEAEWADRRLEVEGKRKERLAEELRTRPQ